MVKKLLFFSLFALQLLVTPTWADSYDYARIFDVTFKAMTQKDLYKALNESVLQQKNPLTQSQIVFLLKKNPEYIRILEQTVSRLKESQAESPEAYTAALKDIKAQLKAVIQTPAFAAQLAAYESPSQPLKMDLPGGAPGYRSMRLFVNHPHLKDATDPKSRVLPGDDLRKVVIDFIRGAEQEIWYNVFDFDLKVIAEALKNQHLKKGVKITGGIDAGTITARPEVKAIFDDLATLESENFKTVAVRSVGLNHQKIILRDPFGPKAAVLFLSGNFTQSCIGPEGDLVDLPKEKRTEYSIPNANHALLILGSLPAQATKAELKKTLEYKIRGQSQYPISGSYKIFGEKQKPNEEAPYIVLSFSPNGGEGDVNKSIYVPLIQNTKGSIEAVHFAFSSKQIQNALLERAARDMQEKGHFDFRSVGDTPFAMREWSAFLLLSGLKKDLTSGKYLTDGEAPILQTLGPAGVTDLQDKIRTAPAIYGERHFRLEDGSAVKTTSKIHHKVFIFPEDSVAVLGTSFNPSENAENNNEQIVIVKDANIVRQARGLFGYLYKNSPRSVTAEANRRNLKALPSPDETVGGEPSERDQ
ncbi:hypothetical protein [Bdellovibrio bacteriovorus]|uniref:hypothetical protein n=1 Tax=Bdellovibrio bacteriovorus TaxID=959 RepID=UPI0035A62ABB